VVHGRAHLGLKVNVTDCPLITDLKASFGSICAAWKSIECGISTSLVSVNSTVSPTRQCTTGPGMSPSKVHAATTVSSVMRRGTSRACQLEAPAGGGRGARRVVAAARSEREATLLGGLIAAQGGRALRVE
jgi:hypothetical protein